ncbi:MAG: helix-turn-helix transcriptional regulator [Thermodesulfobacteriota bacterium]
MAKKQLRKPTQSILCILARNIRSLRHDRNLSQESLADLCGFHRTYIGSVERCERNVTLSTLEALSDALGVTIQDLLTERETKDGDGRGYS